MNENDKNFGDTISKIRKAISKSRSQINCYSNKGNYCAFAFLPEETREKRKDFWYCTDSSGYAHKADIIPGLFGYCDRQTFVCPRE